ncbi:MAG: HD-GYP domain-containing protein, partial [Gammaproteobacteria bacterium]
FIESSKDIRELQQHCQYVLVDPGRYDPAPAPRRGVVKGCTKAEVEPVSATRTSNTTASTTTRRRRAIMEDVEDEYRPLDTNVLRRQIVEAKLAHEQTVSAVSHIFESLRSGNEMRLDAAEQAIEPMVESVVKNEDALSWLARMKKKQDYIHDHSIASCVWAMIFGKHLGLEPDMLKVLGLGALLMDVGKTKVPTEILIKQGKLSDEERVLMRQHVQFGLDIARSVEGVDTRVIEMIESHHERHNGTGYPAGLDGSAIPVFARIGGIVDAYDAMTTPRPYASPVSTCEAMRRLNDLAGVEFQAEMVEQFVQAVGVFPVGTLVELSNGTVGVVIAQNRTRRLRPQVMVLTDEGKAPLNTFRTLDLRNTLVDANGDSLYILNGLSPGEYGLNPSEYYL